ncbi:MAG: hypothetical protein QGH73_01535 [Rhodospirillales bacterium]|jgi:hypothetical protein|nr:hypothetical protein [Rhodospirillaceae bacterium]MDP6426420.1 hypothetical protein [Rhodospirillales bacterium]MDP6645767.1 hypothetical protein [Rhodospirillales bacterium]MDP6840341.1 hypothetical protein [Rhodospirillales bacterium]|tara:strand:+ start:1289 stop:2182 length:894 start_codon:yes stop_codon:yes gene_type:complete
MEFNILLGNLKPHLWEMVSDSVRFVRLALEACGANVRVGTNQLDAKAINLFFDRFYEDQNLPHQMKVAGIRYGLVCTEVLSADGIWNYGAEGGDQGEFAAFELAARNADFIWCLLEESVPACTAMNPNSAYLPFGYLPEMETLVPKPAAARDIDLLMCGFPSPRRDAIMAAFAADGRAVCYPGIPVPSHLRDALMERTRINLSLQKTEAHEIISVTRICHSVINRIPVLLETTDAEAEFAKLCLTTAPGEATRAAARYLDGTDLEAWAETRYQEFADTMPMPPIMARVLAATVDTGY